MSVSYNQSIPIDNLELCLDVDNIKSYSGSGSAWNDLKTNTVFSGANYATAAWANNISALTICIVVEKTGNNPGYASHPINKWNGGTGNASFVLYHFGATGTQGLFSFYYTSGTTWAGIAATTLTVGQKAHLAFQWNSITGAQVWLNGNKVGGRASAAGLLGIGGTGAIVINGPESDGYTRVHQTSLYSRELTDLEVKQHYMTIGKRLGL